MKDKEDQARADVPESHATDPDTAAPNETKGATAPLPQTLRRIWVLHCPFRKSGVPVLGTFGSTIEPVVIFKLETWKRLCQDVPALQTTQFEVGAYE